MTQEKQVATQPKQETPFEKVFLKGDLSSLTIPEKISYYKEFCKRLGLDPFTQPFKLMVFDGKEVLYCDRSGAQQLNKLHNVSHEITSREIVNDCYIVTAKSFCEGRYTENIGAVPLTKANGIWETSSNGKKYLKTDGTFTKLSGDALCNAMMKAETKAKRRATIDILGLGVLDETEIEIIPGATKLELKEISESAPSIEDAKSIIENSKSFSDLQSNYTSLSKQEKSNPEIIALKEKKKQELTPSH